MTCSLLAFLANSLTLYIFVSTRSLHTPFNIYLMFVLTFNIINAVVVCPLDTLAVLYPHWIFGSKMCTAYLYLVWMTQGVIPHTHLLISLNRAWAVIFPHSYRRRMSVKLSMGSCVGLVVYTNVMILPLIVLDAIQYRVDELENGCEVNILAAGGLGAATQYIMYDFPIAMVILLYPVIAVRFFQLRWRASKRRVADNVQSQGQLVQIQT